MSATGGLAKEATSFYKLLASVLADKWDQSYSSTMYWLRCSLSFSQPTKLSHPMQCIRGGGGEQGQVAATPIKLSPVDLVIAEFNLNEPST